MTLPALPYLYCTQTDIENYLSAVGVKLRLDDDQDDIISTQEQEAMTDILAEATETINYYLFAKYTPAILATSWWVNRQATIFGSYRLCSRRTNPVADVVIEDVAKSEKQLEAISEGPKLVPNLPARMILAPHMSNTRCDPRYTFRVIRVERNQSSLWSPTQLQQNVDRADEFTLEM